MRVIISTLLCWAALVSCRQSTVRQPGPSNVLEDEGEIFIIDQAGDRWNITHAVRRYGFDPEGFQFGLGKTAIPPIIVPAFIGPEHHRYPADGDEQLVMGVELEGEIRAYPLFDLSFHETVRDRFGDTPVTVAY